MLHALGDLRRHPLRATDGELGRPHDLVFDERDWRVCYLVAETGSWWRDRLVLVARADLRPYDPRDGTLPVMLDREALRRAATPESDPPLPRRLPLAAYEDLRRLAYAGGFLPAEAAPADAAPPEAGEATLRSAREVTGYRALASDGELGPVEDLVVDDDGWIVRYAVVDAGSWLPGREVLVAAARIRALDWATRRMQVDLARDEARRSAPLSWEAAFPRGHEEPPSPRE